MIAMRTRALCPSLLAIAIILAACVPEPTNRASPADGGSVATPAPTPVPTPAGPTPSPSFVRPTPTPQPTFFIHVVVSGDNLNKIAKLYGTTGRSIAYWNRATYPSLDPDSGAYRPNYVTVGWRLALIPNVEVDPENLPPAAPSEVPAGG